MQYNYISDAGRGRCVNCRIRDGTDGEGTDGSDTLGDTGPAGGFIFYDKRSPSDGWQYLEAAPKSTEWSGITWGQTSPDISGADGTLIGTGSQNTADIIAHQGTGTTYAAQLCDSLIEGGFDDWFLPSKAEMYLMYENLYLQGVGDFVDSSDNVAGYYYSSSEIDADYAWIQDFASGSQFPNPKNGNQRVRAARAY